MIFSTKYSDALQGNFIQIVWSELSYISDRKTPKYLVFSSISDQKNPNSGIFLTRKPPNIWDFLIRKLVIGVWIISIYQKRGISDQKIPKISLFSDQKISFSDVIFFWSENPHFWGVFWSEKYRFWYQELYQSRG